MIKIADNKIIEACSRCNSMREAAFSIDVDYTTFIRRAKKLGCYKPNQGWSKGRFKPKKSMKDILNNKCEYRSTSTLRERLIKEGYKKRKCESCGLDEWMGKKIALELDHIDGDPNNNSIQNLRIICPNCHAQTSTYRGKNIKGKIDKMSEATVVDAIKQSENATQALVKLGLVPKGGNFKKIRTIINRNDGLVFQKKTSKAVITKTCAICGDFVKKNNRKYCSPECSSVSQRKISRPSKDDLQELIGKYNWTELGKMFSVSDNAVRKWARKYKLI